MWLVPLILHITKMTFLVLLGNLELPQFQLYLEM